MAAQVLVCMKCGGPLEHVAALPTLVECGFCGAVISVTLEAAAVTRDGSVDQLRDDRWATARKAFQAELVTLIEAGAQPYEAIRQAAAKFLGTAGQTDTLARVTFALVADFDAKNQSDALHDGTALARVADAYLRAVQELATATKTDINLPFLFANATGPKHLEVTVSAGTFAELARREPRLPEPPQRVAAVTPAPEPPKKKKWWPF